MLMRLYTHTHTHSTVSTHLYTTAYTNISYSSRLTVPKTDVMFALVVDVMWDSSCPPLYSCLAGKSVRGFQMSN